MNTPDPSRRTAPARAAADARFEQQVDREGKLAPKERQRRAALARKLFYADLSRRGIEARKRQNGKGRASS
jgi:hypothetical protein